MNLFEKRALLFAEGINQNFLQKFEKEIKEAMFNILKFERDEGLHGEDLETIVAKFTNDVVEPSKCDCGPTITKEGSCKV